MSPALGSAKRPAATASQPERLRSLLRVVNNAAAHRPQGRPLPAGANALPPIDFAEVSRLLQLAKQALQEERERILGLKERIAKLRGFEEAYFKNQEAIEELRADRDRWRRQAVAMSNLLLSGGEPV